MTMSLLAKRTSTRPFTVSEQVVHEFERARYSIWIANIWFTDNAVYNLLMKKLCEGINVEVILSATKILSCDENAKISRFIEAGGEFFPIRETDDYSLCRSGFCMVDYSTVMDNGFIDKSYLQPGYNAYFIREYPEALVEHYFNEYFSIKNNFCVSRFG